MAAQDYWNLNAGFRVGLCFAGLIRVRDCLRLAPRGGCANRNAIIRLWLVTLIISNRILER
jgi:hypothetical protein